jgi:hypothetical protein
MTRPARFPRILRLIGQIKLDNSNGNLLKWTNELRNTILPDTIALRWRPASVATSDATTSFALIQVSPLVFAVSSLVMV